MIYPHQQKAIDYITAKFQADCQVDALLISGSIAHGYNDEKSDVDINIIVSNNVYEKRKRENALIYWQDASEFYSGGYFDGKFITLDYLALVAERGNEPTRFALRDCIVAFDRTGQVADYLKIIGEYDTQSAEDRAYRFQSHLEAWKWYCEQAIAKDNAYLLDLSVSKLILFAGRLILLANKKFFPYHKWFLRALDESQNKPPEFMSAINHLLADKSLQNISRLYQLTKDYSDWTNGRQLNWPPIFLADVETVWMRQDDCVENM